MEICAFLKTNIKIPIIKQYISIIYEKEVKVKKKATF